MSRRRRRRGSTEATSFRQSACVDDTKDLVGSWLGSHNEAMKKEGRAALEMRGRYLLSNKKVRGPVAQRHSELWTWAEDIMGGGRGLLPIIFENAFELKVYRSYTFRKRVLVLRLYRTASRVSCGRGPKTPLFTRPPSYTFLLWFRGRRTRGRFRVSLARRARQPEGR